MARRLTWLSTLSLGLRKAYRGLSRDLGGAKRALTLRSPKQAALAALPAYLPLGDKVRGQALLGGEFLACGARINVGTSGDPWTIALPSLGFAKSMHRFDWLFDLAMLGDEAGPKARALTDSWAAVYGKWNAFSWQADVLTDRLFAQLCVWSTLLGGTDDKAAARRSSFARQARYLKRIIGRAEPGLPTLKATATLAMAGAALGDKALLDKYLDKLDDILEDHILGDGGYIDRRPGSVVSALHILLTLEAMLAAKAVPGSRQTRRAIDRMTPVLSFFSLSDGQLASFNGSGEVPGAVLRRLTKAAGVKARPFSYMPHSRYQRLERGKSVMIIDGGAPPPRPFDTEAHLGPLSFELSSGASRIVVNCGWNGDQNPSWRAPMRETAAHSTLVLDDCSAGEVLETGLRAKILGAALRAGPADVFANRKEQEGGIWIELAHDGYLSATGLKHRRRIFMDETGHDLRGEDTLFIPAGGAPRYLGARFPFDLRFHLHPDIRVTLSQDKRSALLILKTGEGWRFRTNAPQLSLEKSVYLAKGAAPARNEQLVIRGSALSDNDGEDRSNKVLWTFRRLGELGAGKSGSL